MKEQDSVSNKILFMNMKIWILDNFHISPIRYIQPFIQPFKYVIIQPFKYVKDHSQLSGLVKTNGQPYLTNSYIEEAPSLDRYK